MEKKKPIILDRTRLEQYAGCPREGYLQTIWDALKAKAEGYEVFPWEQKILDEAEPVLIEAIKKVALQAKDSRIGECGTKIHELIERAFVECKNDTSEIPQWFVDNLPNIQPNIQPMAIRHARHAADMLSEFHVSLIGLEQQISLIVYPETALRPAVIATMRLDLLGSGKGCLHVMDWKTGYKRRSNSETAESFQAQMAAFLLFEQKEYQEINTIHFWYFETMGGTKAYARFDRLVEHPRLPGLTTQAAVKGRVMAAVDLFLAGCKDPWPLPDTCAWCDMIRFCPYANMDAKEIADNPKLFTDTMAVSDARLKRMKQSATDWIKAKGPLVGTKVQFSQKIPQERFTAGFEDLAKPKSGATGDDELDGHFVR